MPRRAGRLGRRRIVVIGTVAAAALAAGASAWATSGSSAGKYRTATAATGSVQDMLTDTGTVSPLHSADVNFQVSGTVAKLLVHQGEEVVSGQTLARLDRTTLKAALASAQSTLRRDRATLASNETGQQATAGNGATTANDASSPSTPTNHLDSRPVTAVPATPAPHPSASGGGNGSPASSTIPRDQTAVTTAQHQLDLDLPATKRDLQVETAACADELSGTTPSSPDDCTSAATTLLTAQQTVASDETKLAQAENTLAAALTQALTTLQHSAVPTPSPSRSTSGKSGVSTRTTTGATTRTVSAATLASDQAAIDTAEGNVAAAKADLAQTVLRAPMGGKVSAVTIADGDSVSASSGATNPAVEIVGSHDSKVTVGLSAAQVRQVRSGMTAQVTPDGFGRPLRGTVTSIGVAPTASSTTGESTYPVTIDIATSTRIISGADAAASIVLATAHNVLTVPTSAVHQAGSVFSVQILSNGKPTTRRVTVGVRGSTLTQITSGLATGTTVVLANLHEAVPSSSTNRTFNRGGLGGSGLGNGGGFVRRTVVGGGAPPTGGG